MNPDLQSHYWRSLKDVRRLTWMQLEIFRIFLVLKKREKNSKRFQYNHAHYGQFCCQSTLLKDCRRESESLKSPYESAGRTSEAQAARPHAGLRIKPATNCLGKHCTTALPGSWKNSKTCFILFFFNEWTQFEMLRWMDVTSFQKCKSNEVTQTSHSALALWFQFYLRSLQSMFYSDL